jgi:hypothetical protein
VEEGLAEREVNEPDRLSAEDLLRCIDVVDVLRRQAGSGALGARYEESRVVEAKQLAEIGEEGEIDVVGIGDTLAPAADRIPGAFRCVVAGCG